MAVALRNSNRRRESDPFLSFLVISTSDLCKKVELSLHQAAQERRVRIAVHQCEDITEVLRQKSDLSVDIILFAIDGRISQSVTEVENNLRYVDENYIVLGCVWLVCCNEATAKPSEVYFKSKQLAEKYLLQRFLSANILDIETNSHLGNRLLNLAEGILGLTVGLPIIDYSINFIDQ